MDMRSLMNLKVTTASKKTEKLSEVPASMVVITKDEIQTYGYTSISEIIENAPGFYSLGAANIGYGATNFGVRGFSTTGFFSTVMVMVNGVNQMDDINNMANVDALNIPLSSINRIEIVRGPMAVLYGSNAFLGAINIITDAYDETEESEVFVSAGSLNTLSGGGYVSGSEGPMKFKVSVGYTKSDGQDLDYADLISNPALQNAYTGGTETSAKGHLTRTSFYTAFNGKYKDFSVDLANRRYESGNFAFLPAVNEGGFNTTTDQTTFKFGYNPKINENTDLGIKYTTSMFNWSSENIHLLAPSNATSYSSNTVNHEIEATLEYSKDKFDVVGGLNYRVVPKLERYTDVPVLALPRARTYLKNPYATKSAFIQANYKVTDWFKITAGLRAEHTNDFDLEAVWQQTGSAGQDSAYAFPYNGSVEQGGLVFIPRLAAVMKVNETNVIKVMYGNSKKRASAAESVTSSDPNTFQLGMANMQTIELNYMTTITKIKSALNLNVFFNSMTGLPVNTVEIDGTDVTQNTTSDGEMSTIGAEFNWKFTPTKKLNIEAAVSYQSNNDATEGYDTIDVAFTPEVLVYLKAYYKVNSKISIGLKGRYVSEMYAQYNLAAGSRYGEDIPSYFLLDLNLLVTDIYKGLGLSIYASNALDNEVRYATNNKCILVRQRNDWIRNKNQRFSILQVLKHLITINIKGENNKVISLFFLR